MKTFVSICILLAVAVPAETRTAVPAADESIALVSRVILDVMRKEASADWQKAVRGEILNSGDRIRTGVHSLAVIKFKDNSMVRVRELSELTVTASVRGNAFSKTVDIQTGTVGFNVNKQQQDEEFRFSTPTSVASVRGTEGLLISQADADTLTVLDGLVHLTNMVSAQSLDVPAGYTGISRRDGSLTVHASTPDERQAARNALESGTNEKKLEFELRDRDGKTRQLDIDYHD